MNKYKVIFQGFSYITQSFVVDAVSILDAIKQGEEAHKARFPNDDITEILSIQKGNY